MIFKHAELKHTRKVCYSASLFTCLNCYVNRANLLVEYIYVHISQIILLSFVFIDWS